jgi:hypothetical protein
VSSAFAHFERKFFSALQTDRLIDEEKQLGGACADNMIRSRRTGASLFCRQTGTGCCPHYFTLPVSTARALLSKNTAREGDKAKSSAA